MKVPTLPTAFKRTTSCTGVHFTGARWGDTIVVNGWQIQATSTENPVNQSEKDNVISQDIPAFPTKVYDGAAI